MAKNKLSSRKKMPSNPVRSGRVRKNRRRRGFKGAMSQVVSAPIAFGMNARSMGPSSMGSKIVERGSELLSLITVQPNTSAGRVLYSYLLNPSLMVQTRLNKFSRVYGSYKYTSLSLEYIPASPTTADGNIIIALDPDVTRSLNNTDVITNLSYAMDIEASETGSVFLPHHVSANCRKSKQNLYFTDPRQSVAQSNQFRVLVMQGITNTTVTGGYGFMLKLHYAIEFSQTENTPIAEVALIPITVLGGSVVTIDATDASWTFAAAAPGPPIIPPNPVLSGIANGAVYVCNPQMCLGIELFAPCIGSVILNTTSGGSQPKLIGFVDYETTQAQTAANPGKGGVQGNGMAVTLPSNLYLIPVGQSSIGYHT